MFQRAQYIYEVYKAGSFSKAAQNLYISQPSLSAAVKRVEEKVGSPLFDRSTNPIRLTECGRAYIRAMEEMQDTESHFRNFVNDVEGLRTGSLSIGGTTLFTAYILPRLLARFMETYPGVELNLVETHTAALEKMLFAGHLDLVIDNLSMNPTVYRSERYGTEHLILAVPKELAVNEQLAEYQLTGPEIREGRHLTTGMPGVPLARFGRESFLLLKHGNDTRTRADKLCQNAGFKPRVRLLLDQQMTAYRLACSGMGIAFVSDTLVRSAKTEHEVWYYKLDAPESEREIHFYYKKNRYFTRAMQEFLRLAEEVPNG